MMMPWMRLAQSSEMYITTNLATVANLVDKDGAKIADDVDDAEDEASG